jgi:hypothetical protein
VKRNVAVAVAAVVLVVGVGLGAVAISFWRVAVRDGVRYFSRMRLRYWHGGQRDYVFRWAVLPGATIPGWNGGPSA